jgi:hypothetical protein
VLVVCDGCMVVLVVYEWRGRRMVCMCVDSVKCVELLATAGMSQRHVAWMRRDVVCAAWVWRRGEVCVCV